MGDSSGVFPVAMGVIVFIVVLTMVLTIPSFQETTVGVPDNIIGKVSSDPSTLLGREYVDWLPVNGWTYNVTNTSDNQYNSGNYYMGYNNLDFQFTDPNYPTHFVDVRVIRNSSSFGAPWSWSIEEVFHKYYNYISFDGYITEWGVDWNSWESTTSFSDIEISQVPGTNYSVVDIGSYNISLLIMSPGTESNFITDLYNNNNMTIHLVQNPHVNYNDFWQVLWWIVSFNNAWMPTAPWIAMVVSFIVDIALALLLLFIAQGFIP